MKYVRHDFGGQTLMYIRRDCGQLSKTFVTFDCVCRDAVFEYDCDSCGQLSKTFVATLQTALQYVRPSTTSSFLRAVHKEGIVSFVSVLGGQVDLLEHAHMPHEGDFTSLTPSNQSQRSWIRARAVRTPCVKALWWCMVDLSIYKYIYLHILL